MSKLTAAMSIIRRAGVVLGVVTLFTASPAYAGPLAGLIPIVIGAVVKSAVLKLALSVAATLALSLLQKQKNKSPGIKIESTLNGGTNSRTIVAGLYATAGSNVTPPMSYGTAGKTPNANLVKVIAIADVPIDGLSRIIINGEYVPLIGGPSSYTFGGKYAGKGTLRFFDGRQVTADAATVAVLGGYPNRPWTNTRVGLGMAYAVVTFFYDQELYKGEPEVRFEVRGMRFYDIRKDSTAGGSGTHRWNNPATWEFTVNNVVIIYNILRGIALTGGAYYGGNCTVDQLPTTNWTAAMNICDQLVGTTTGNVKRYAGGYEWSVDDQPADVIEEFLKGCAGEMVENGGIYKIRVGGPGLPVLFITDDDWMITEEEELDPFPSIHGSVNTVRAVYPHPEELWQQHDAPTVFKQTYIDMDEGQELVADLSLPAVPYPNQVQRLMLAWLEDDRRWRRHTGVLSHKAFALEPLDVVSWTSAYNGYSNKLFDTSAAGVNFYNLQVSVAIKEVDPTDYNWNSGLALADPIAGGGWAIPESQAVDGFAVSAWTVQDADATDRRPAIRAVWSPDGAVDATAVRVRVRVAATQALVCDVTVAMIDATEVVISEGILPSTAYEVQARYLVERPTLWTSWLGVTTGNVLIGNKDLNFDQIMEVLGPSMLIPSLLSGPSLSITEQIRDIAFNDIAIRERGNVDIRAIGLTYENRQSIQDEVLARIDNDEVINGRIDLANSLIDANSAAIVQEASTRFINDTALATQITVVGGRVDDNTAAILSESNARVTADTALGTRIDSVVATAADNTAAIIAEATARTDADTSLAGQITVVQADVAANTAAIINEANTRTTADEALATSISTVAGVAAGNTAAITAEVTARSNADTAIGSRIDTVETNVGTNTAAIASEVTARSTADSALSSRLDVVESTSGNNSAAISNEVTARTNADNALTDRISIAFSQVGENVAATIQEIATRSSNVLALTTFTNSLAARVGDNSMAAVQQEASVRATETEALAQTITVVQAQVNSNAALIQNETTARVTGDSALAFQLNNLETVVGTNTSAIASEISARSSADSALALSITNLTATVGDNTTAISNEVTARANADSALGTRIDTVETNTGTNTAGIASEVIARTNADSALGARIDTVEASTSTNTAGIASEILARTNADTALGARIDTVEGTVAGNTAAISAETTARSNADTAIAGNVTTLTARLNNAGGSGVTMESRFTAQASSITGLLGQYTLKLNVNGRVSGFGLASSGTSSEFAILADRFIVVNPANNSTTGYPFQVVGGNVYIRKAFIQTITSDMITTGTFITGSAQIGNGVIASANIGDLQVGTIKIANNSLTVPFHTAGTSTFITKSSGETTVVETAVLNIGDVGAPATCSVGFYGTACTHSGAGFGPDAAADIKMYVDLQDGNGYRIMGAQAVGIDVTSGNAYFWIPISLIDLEVAVINAKFKVTATSVTSVNGQAAVGMLIGAPTLIVQGAKK